jgi:hypothetical protein
MYKGTYEALSCNHFCSGTAISITYSECVCSLRYPPCNAHAPCCPVRLYNIFPHYLINGKKFEKKKVLNIKCVFRFSLQLLSGTFLILRRTERDVIKIYIGLHVKCPLALSDLNKTLIFSTDFRKKTQI